MPTQGASGATAIPSEIAKIVAGGLFDGGADPVRGSVVVEEDPLAMNDPVRTWPPRGVVPEVAAPDRPAVLGPKNQAYVGVVEPFDKGSPVL